MEVGVSDFNLNVGTPGIILCECVRGQSSEADEGARPGNQLGAKRYLSLACPKNSKNSSLTILRNQAES